MAAWPENLEVIPVRSAIPMVVVNPGRAPTDKTNKCTCGDQEDELGLGLDTLSMICSKLIMTPFNPIVLFQGKWHHGSSKDMKKLPNYPEVYKIFHQALEMRYDASKNKDVEMT